MTSAEFTAKYQLGEPMAPHGSRSYHAVQSGTGALVMVHYLDDRSADERAAVLRCIERLVPPECDLVLDITEVDGTVVVVTQPLPNAATLDAWLDPTGSGRSPEPGEAVPAAPGLKGARTPGEFTRLFKSPVAAPVPEPPAVVPPAPAARPTVPPAAAVPAEPPAPPIPAAPSAPPALATPPAPPAPAAPPQAPQPAAPGEFTRIFQAPRATPASGPALRPPPAPPATAPVGGADAKKPRVTMRPSSPEPPWGTPLGGNTPPSPVPPPAASGPPFPAPGMPPAPVTPVPAMPPAPTLPPTPAQPSPVSATGALRAQIPPVQGSAPSIIPLPSLAPPPSAVPAAPVAPVSAGPSAFTRVISAPARPATPPPAAPAAPPPDEQPKPAARSYLPLILVLNVVLVGVVAIILYFALAH